MLDVIVPDPQYAGLMGRTVVNHDDRNWLFPARELLSPAPLQSRLWSRPSAWDQGQTSQCVAFSTKGVVNSEPLVGSYSGDAGLIDPGEIYRLAQTLDEWPGEAYNGTSTLAGFKAAQQLGFLDQYRWCFGAQDVLDTLSQHGPVAIGVQWYRSMFSAPGGVLTVDQQSGPAGGHCVELHGLDVERQVVIGTNSWSTGWGDGGRFYLSFADLDRLLQQQGEAVTACFPPVVSLQVDEPGGQVS